MSIHWARRGAVLFFLLFIVAVTWPGMILGNHIFPLVLGLPFSMVWIASWVVLSFLVLIFLDRAEERARGGAAGTRPADTTVTDVAGTGPADAAGTGAETGTPAPGEDG